MWAQGKNLPDGGRPTAHEDRGNAYGTGGRHPRPVYSRGVRAGEVASAVGSVADIFTTPADRAALMGEKEMHREWLYSHLDDGRVLREGVPVWRLASGQIGAESEPTLGFGPSTAPHRMTNSPHFLSKPPTAAVLLLALALLCGAGPCARAADRPPNVVLILADDLGYGDLGCYGAKQIRTPRLDRMASEGLRLTDFLVSQAVCTASRASLLSGCYANRVGMSGALNHTSRNGIHPDELLLPEIFKKQGYATACYGKWHLGTLPQFFPTRNGFDKWAGLPYSNDNGPAHPTIPGMPSLPWYEGDEVVETDPDQSGFTGRITRHAVDFIKQNRSAPFFLYLPHIMPHVPIAASPAFRGKSTQGLYGDAVEELDAAVGVILDTLQGTGLDKSTLVVFLSDNGPFLSYGEHAGSAGRLRGGKLTCFEGGVREPCILRWPGRIAPNSVSNELVASLDLLPTLAGLCGGAIPGRKIDGLDVWPLLSGQTPASPRKSFAYFNGTALHAVRSGKWKLHVPHEYLEVAAAPGAAGKPSNWKNMKPLAIENSGIGGIASRHGYRVEHLPQSLFNLEQDPSESQEVSAQHPRLVEELLALAEDFRTDLGDSQQKRVGRGNRPAGLAEAAGR
jgi:arylsulfatase A-like enzyme